MARLLRLQYPGAIYHITFRANSRESLFRDDEDRRYLLWRLSEGVEAHGVRVFLFCLMSNHAHLVIETPGANLSRFMHSVLTGYTIHCNRRHGRHGHVTQGRYGAKLVDGDEYLLKLSRYVHLNPVSTRSRKRESIDRRLGYLDGYTWSSYQAYAGLKPRNKFVDYGPMLSLMKGRKTDQSLRYREYVTSGLAGDSDDFEVELMRSPRAIGSEKFREHVDEQYSEMLAESRSPEDISFRTTRELLPVADILDVVASSLGIDVGELQVRRRSCLHRGIAARMLIRYGGLTQRESAEVLGLGTGVAVSCQLKRLRTELDHASDVSDLVQRIENKLTKSLILYSKG